MRNIKFLHLLNWKKFAFRKAEWYKKNNRELKIRRWLNRIVMKAAQKWSEIWIMKSCCYQ